MSPYYEDTHPRMEALQVQLLRDSPPWRKMQILSGLNAAARELVMIGLRQRFPQANEAEINYRLAGLLLGQDLAQKVLGEVQDYG